MSPSTLLRGTTRAPFSTSSSFFTAQTRHAFRQTQRFTRQNRRWQSTTSEAGGPGSSQQQSWFQRMWQSEIGFKTVHFWAPVMKWALVIAGLSDLSRPAEKLSVTQNAALTATGIIWTRWCFVIKPKNYLLAAVNFFLGCTGVMQLTRIAMWRSSQSQTTPGDLVEDAKENVEKVAEKAKEAIKA